MANSAAITLQPQSGKDYVLATWDRAHALFRSELAFDEEKKIQKYGLETASFEDLRQQAIIAKTSVDSSRSVWGSRLRKIAELIIGYGAAEDAIISVTPYNEYTALAVGALRFLIDAALEESRTAESLSDALETITVVIFRAEQYARLFTAQHSDATKHIFALLQEKLTQLYSQSLRFLALATVFFKTSRWKRHMSSFLTTFNDTFNPILQRIHRYEVDVQKDVELLRVEADIQREEFENGLWLPHTDSDLLLRDIQSARTAGTSSWFLKTPEYSDWKVEGASSGFLWCSGKPGCGKSTLAAFTIADLQSNASTVDPAGKRKNIFVAQIFCKVGLTNAASVFHILSNFIYQSLHHQESARACHMIVQKARLQAKTSVVASVDLLWSIAESIVEQVDRCFCVIDGLDECSDAPHEKAGFVERLFKLFRTRSTQHKLAVFTRQPEPPVEIKTYWNILKIQSAEVSKDIEMYVYSKSNESKVLAGHPRLSQLQQKLIEGAEGVFLWTKLMIEGLERDRWNPERVLGSHPKGLFDIYSITLQQLASNPEVGKKVLLALKLVLGAFRSLTIKEILLAIAVQEGLSNHADFDRMCDVDAEGTELMNHCGSLLILNSIDEVNFSHTSVHEYLSRELESTKKDAVLGSAKSDLQPSALNEAFSSLLVKYMSLERFNFDSPDPSCVFTTNEIAKIQMQHSLYSYSAQYLIAHCVNSGTSHDLLIQLRDFFGTYNGYYWLLASVSASLNSPDWMNRRNRLRKWALNACKTEDEVTFFKHWDEAIKWTYMQKLEESAKQSDASWLKVLNSQLSLVQTFRMHDSTTRVDKLCRVRESSWKTIQGENSPAAYRLMGERALYWMGEDANATNGRELLEKSAVGLNDALGTKHQLTLEIEAALYASYAASMESPSEYYLAGRDLGQIGQRLEKDALEVLGESNATVHAIRRAHAENAIAAGRPSEALVMYELLFDQVRTRRGLHDMATQYYWMRRWDTLWQMDRKQDAIALLRQQIETQKGVLELYNPSYLGLVKTLAVALDRSGEHTESDALIVEATIKAVESLNAGPTTGKGLEYHVPKSVLMNDFQSDSLPPFPLSERRMNKQADCASVDSTIPTAQNTDKTVNTIARKKLMVHKSFSYTDRTLGLPHSGMWR